MEVEVLFFGQLTDKTACARIVMPNPGTIGRLKKVLCEQYPALRNTHFVMALQNKIAQEDDCIGADATVALMPPFSGG